MGDLLDRGAAFLDAQRHQHLSRPVLYRRGTDEKEVLPAGKCGVWGLPFSGTPIRFDDLRVTRVQP